MTHPSNPDPTIQRHNDESLRILSRALTMSQGTFSLTLARCDYRHLQQVIVEQLQQLCPFEIRCLTLTQSTETLYSSIVAELGDDHPDALMVFGLEQVQNLATVLNSTNQVREEFRKNFEFPVVLWIDSRVQQALIRSAPDFESWSTAVDFEIQSEDVRRFLTAETDQIFNTLLEVGAGLFLDNRTLQIHPNSPLLVELERGQALLRNRSSDSDPLLDGSVEFVLGRAKVVDEAASKAHYDRSIELLATSNSPDAQERLGCTWHHLGVWWRTYSIQHRAEYHDACVQARDCFERAIVTFEAAQRDDLVARFTEKLGEVLQRMQDWEGLKQLVQKCLLLHETYPDLFRQSRTYGFRAEIALAKADQLAQPMEDGQERPKAQAEANAKSIQDTLIQAKEWAEQALQLLQEACEAETIPAAFERETFLDWHNCFLKGWYCFALGRAYKGLGETEQAIQTLEMAKDEVKESYDPPLYINILQALRQLYFDQEDYLKAFDTRQAYRSIEQQYGYRAFVGAGRLQAKKAITNPSLAHVETVGQVSTEIARSGRQQDVERLIGRLQRSDQKLIVLHGQSGVGKSSIIQAGLIPALTPLTFEGREVAVVLQQVYTPWDKRLGDRLLETLRRLEHRATDEALESSEAILQKIEQTINQNFMAVLILDQFEEFFFVYKDPSDRKLFYQFLRDCLAIPYVKVVLSLREDYLHYLLECNDRLVTLNIVNNNILDKDILYYLGNFSPDDAKSVIEGLTHQSQFSLETDLVEALVQDLAQELGEIRPIELQVAGNQLQTEDITTLEGYAEKGPKEALVGRFLEEIVQDCGPDNEQFAKLVLYLLTDENNTRPLKTRADLELELDIESGKLDLILALLVKSRLVFLIPASPNDRYQLVHDYLVPFVRQQQSARLIAEIEKEREQRKLTEAKLNNALKQQLRTARRATFTLIGLFTITVGVALLTSMAFINSSINNQNTLSSKKQNIDRVVSSLKTGKFFKRWKYIVIPEIHLATLSELNQALSNQNLRNRIEAHNDEIKDIKISNKGKLFASASADATVKIWNYQGVEIASLEHPESVTSIQFNIDDTELLTGSKDGKLRFWNLETKEISKIFKGHEKEIVDIQFSPDRTKIASIGKDKILNIWNLSQNKVIKSQKNETDIIAIRFSPNGKLIASLTASGGIFIWDLKNENNRNFSANSYQTIDVDFISNYEIYTVNKNGSRIRYSIDGRILSGNSVDVQLSQFKRIKDKPFSAYIDTKKSPKNIFIDYLNQLSWEGYHEIDLEHLDRVSHFDISSDGRWLVSTTENNQLYIWELSLKKSRDKNDVTMYSPRIHPIILNFDKDIVATKENGNWSFQSLISDKKYDFKVDGNSFSFSPKSNKVIGINTGISSFFWDLNGQKIELEDIKGDRFLTSGSKVNDEKFVFGFSDGSVAFFDFDGKFIKEIGRHEKPLEKVISNSIGDKIASSDGKTIKIWNDDGSLLNELHVDDNYDKWIRSEFSPNGKFFVTQNTQGTVSLWTNSGILVKNLDGHSSSIFTVNFNSKDEKVITASYEPGKSSKASIWQTDGKIYRFIKALSSFYFIFASRG